MTKQLGSDGVIRIVRTEAARRREERGNRRHPPAQRAMLVRGTPRKPWINS